MLDPRGMFIVMTDERAWLWAGSKIFAGNKQAYRNAAFTHYKLLQTHERAPQHITPIEQGSEPAEFWNDFGLPGAPSNCAYDLIPEWSDLFIDLDVASKQTKGKTATKEIEEYREQLAEENLYKAKLFAYPDL